MSGDDADLAARMDEVVQKGRAEFEGFDNSSNFVVTMSADRRPSGTRSESWGTTHIVLSRAWLTTPTKPRAYSPCAERS